MSTTVVIQLGPDAAALLEKLKAYPREMQQAIRRGMDRANALVTRQMTRSRFTGKGPFPVSEGKLGVRTGRLRRSLLWAKATIDPAGNVTGAIGSNVEYMGVHEFGFSGEVQVRAHRRSRFTAGGKQISIANASKLRGKKKETLSASTHDVRGHSRRVNVPERAPVRRGISDGKATYADEITKALAAAWEKKGAQT